MEDRNTAMIVLLLLCVTAEMQVDGFSVDVCASCHAKATCDEKSDGSGKVCNCMYGFVGNGRALCEDKDECRIGVSQICGPHTYCHNTQGSYYCTCLSGFTPSNNMDVFIPNDGTHCKDIDECTATGLCREGGQCRNLEGSFECSCILGYEVQNGAEPFHPHRDNASCKVIDCGRPEAAEDTVLLSLSGTTYHSAAMFVCEEGFVWRRGNNRSLCEDDGLWRGGNMSCEDIDECTVTGLCGEGGQCRNLEGSFECRCILGYEVRNGAEPFHPHRDRASCKVVDCGRPQAAEDTVLLSFSGTTYHSAAMFVCEEGFVWTRGNNRSVCEDDGLWRGGNMSCEAKCGPAPVLDHSEVVWHNRSVVVHRCEEGYHSWRGSNVSECESSGEWRSATLTCIAKCGPAPVLDHSEVVWHNRSVVVHRCEEGYHSWRGSNVSECESSGEWRSATLTCIEIKPPVNHLRVLNEKCVQWRAEKYEEDTETYKVTYTGSRDYQRSFQDRRKRLLSSKADELQLCLNLLPVTNYSISITAASSRFTASITTNTSLTVPPALAVDYKEFETPVPTLKLRRSPNTLDPISVYQVFVLPVDRIIMFDCSSPASSDPKSKSSAEYITGQFDVQHVGTEMNFTVGDGLLYGGFFNAPLQNGRSYYIILRAVSQWKSAFKSSCVVWARVKGTSYVRWVSSLSAVAAIGLVTFVIIGGYSFCWLFKRTHS